MGVEDKFIHISKATRQKIEHHHGVVFEEIEEAFFNSLEPYPIDKRPKHKTNPPTQYLIAPTFSGRYLKVVFIVKELEEKIEIKSAFEPEALDLIKYLDDGGKIPWV